MSSLNINVSEMNYHENSGKCTYKFCQSETAEVGTLGLEFRALSYASGDMRYATTVNKTADKLLAYNAWDGLVGRYLYVVRDDVVSDVVRQK